MSNGNRRKKLHRMMINPPVIPAESNLEHVGTAFQISRSTDFTDESSIILQDAVYKEDGRDILLIQNEIDISLDEVIYSRYAYIFGQKGQVQPDRDQYTINQWSRMSSSHGDQSGYKFDNTVLTTPVIEFTELIGSAELSGYRFTVSGYRVLVGENSEHKYTSWEISNTNNEIIYSRVKDEDNVKELILDKKLFDKNSMYFIRAKVFTANNGESNWGVFVFNPVISGRAKFQLEFIEPFYHPMNLFMRLKLLTSNVTKIRIVIKEVFGDFESAAIYDQQLDPSRSIKIPSSTFTKDKTYRMYACLKYSNNTFSALTFVREFSTKVSNLYPVRVDSRYSEQGTLFSFPGVSTGPSVLVTRELRDGTFVMGVNSEEVAGSGEHQNELILYARYGDSIRNTNIRIPLPNGAPSIGANDLNYPLINVIPLYDDRIVINYCSYADGASFKRSVWCVYEANWVTKSFTCLGYSVHNDEGLSTAVSGSAVVIRDNSIVYIPAEYYGSSNNGAVAKKWSGVEETSITNRRWGSSDGSQVFTWNNVPENAVIRLSDDLKGLKVKVIRNHHGGNSVAYSPNISMSGLRGSTGFTLGFRLKLTLNSSNKLDNSLHDAYSPILGFIDRSNGKLLSMGVNRNETNNLNKFIFDFHQTLGDGGPNRVASEIPLTNEYQNFVFTVTDQGAVHMFVNDTLVRTWVAPNKSLNDYDKFIIGCAPGMASKSQFEIKDIIFINRHMSDAEVLKGFGRLEEIGISIPLKDLPLLKVEINSDGGFSNKFRRSVLRETIKSGVKRFMTMCPYNEMYPGDNKVFIAGGSSDESFRCTSDSGHEIPGMFYYKLENLSTWLYDVPQGSLTEKTSLPETIRTVDNNNHSIYNLSAYRRADGKIVLFNNSPTTRVGGEATNTETWLVDLEKTRREEFCVRQNNDSAVDMPFRSTIALRDGSFLRIGNTATTMPPILGYMADPVNAATTTPTVANKNLIVKVGERIAIENPYLYDTIVIEGDSDTNTGILTWAGKQRIRTFTWNDRIITRDLEETQEQADANSKERLHVLDGVRYTIKK